MKIFKKMKKGFTLVELVVVIAVIAILAAVSVGAYFGVTESANRSKLEQEGKQVQTAIQTISLAGNEHSSLTSNGLVLSNPGEFRLALEESLGKDIALTDNIQNGKDNTKATIYFSDVAIQSELGDKTYKSFEYHLPEINGKAAHVDVVTGEVKVVETNASGEDLPEVLPTVTTISEALTAEVGYPARISGTVKEVTYTWNGSTMSYKLTDGTNEILVYICKTEVALGDIVTVTGEIGAYNGANQIVKSTAEITGHDDSYDIQTITSIADALTAPLSTEVELTGTVTEINAEYTSATETSFYLTDDSNASIYVFKLPGKVYLNDKVKVIGQIGQYYGVNQVAKGATFEVIERHTCTYSEATCFEPEKCTICDAVKEGSTKLDHTAPNEEGNCERCGNKVDEVSVTVNIAAYAVEHSWQDKTLYDEIIADDNITITSTKDPSKSNTGKYYVNGQNWRIYQNENPSVIITASNGKEITKVQITYTIDDTGILTFNGNNIPSNQIVEVNATTATFGVGNTEESVTNGKVLITDFVIYYANASVVEPPHEHNFVNGECECGETDPNYQPPHEHNFVNGECECGETDPNYQPPTSNPTSTNYEVNFKTNFTNYTSTWGNIGTYGTRELKNTDLGFGDSTATVTMTNTSRQSGTITDVPVVASKSSAAQYVTLKVSDGEISKISFSLVQWTNKKFKTLTIEYSSDGSAWVTTGVGFTNANPTQQADSVSPLSYENLPENTKYVRLVVLGGTTSNNQVGISAISYTKVTNS